MLEEVTATFYFRQAVGRDTIPAPKRRVRIALRKVSAGVGETREFFPKVPIVAVSIQRQIQGVVRRKVVDNVGQLHNAPIFQAMLNLNQSELITELMPVTRLDFWLHRVYAGRGRPLGSQ